MKVELLRVRDVAAVFNGKTPSKAQQRDEGHPVLKIKDVDALGRFKGSYSGHVDLDVAEKSRTKTIRGGETLILNAAHNASHVASKTFYATDDVVGALATGEWLMIRWDEEKIDSRFGHHWINAPETRFRLRDLVNGIHLYPKDVGRLSLSLPPLAEQKRIAKILDAADALRAKRRESLAQLDALLQSTFLDLFGDPVSNPLGWEVAKFGDVGQSRLGKMLDKGKQAGSRFPYLANFNVRWDGFDLSELREMAFSESDREEFSLKDGDLLVCEGGEVGRAAIWRGGAADLYFQKALHRVRLKPELALPEFVLFYLWFMAKNGGFSDFTNSATIAHLTGVKLKSLPIPLPPIEKQKKFQEVYLRTKRNKKAYNLHAEGLDFLFHSLQHRAFFGEL